MRIICLTLSILFSLYAHAEVYKWTDEQGNVHYGDKPGAADKSVEIQVDTSQTTSTVGDDWSREEKRQKLLETMEEDRIEKQEQRAKQKVERDRKRSRCNWMRDKLKRLKRATGVYRLDKDGNRVYQSSDKRKRSEASLQKQINKNCR